MSIQDSIREAVRRAVRDSVRSLVERAVVEAVDEVMDDVIAEVVAETVAETVSERVRDRFRVRAEKARGTKPGPVAVAVDRSIPIPIPTLLSLEEIRDQFPDAPPDADEIEDETKVRECFGPCATRLTPAIAARLIGRTAYVLAGQNWWGAEPHERFEALARMTFHAEIEADVEADGGFVVSGDDGETYELHVYQGYLGSGSGSDPVFVFVR